MIDKNQKINSNERLDNWSINHVVTYKALNYQINQTKPQNWNIDKIELLYTWIELLIQDCQL